MHHINVRPKADE